MISNIAGPRITTPSDGNIRKISGKSILTGALCARSSACWRRRTRMSTARLRITTPIETPSALPCTTERTNADMFGVSTRASVFVSASDIPRPMLCSCIVRRTSSPIGARIRVDETSIDAPKPRPASSVTTSMSIRSGTWRSIWSSRRAARPCT